jgi:hypothetical protein
LNAALAQNLNEKFITSTIKEKLIVVIKKVNNRKKFNFKEIRTYYIDAVEETFNSIVLENFNAFCNKTKGIENCFNQFMCN